MPKFKGPIYEMRFNIYKTASRFYGQRRLHRKASYAQRPVQSRVSVLEEFACTREILLSSYRGSSRIEQKLVRKHKDANVREWDLPRVKNVTLRYISAAW